MTRARRVRPAAPGAPPGNRPGAPPPPDGPWRALRTAGGPIAVVDLDAFDANAEGLLRRAAGTPIRVASKSVRSRALISRVLQMEGYAGVLGYSVREAVWLAEHGIRDVVVAYPSVDRDAIAAVASSPALAEQICFMVDLPEHVRLLVDLAVLAGARLRVAIDADCSLRLGPLSVGVHRSKVRTPEDAGRLAGLIARTPGVRLCGLMLYEAQVAGVPDDRRGIRLVKRLSNDQLSRRRREIRAAVEGHGSLELVNGGGTGSLHTTRLDPAVTELAAGSGLFMPASFDGFADLGTRPAAWFASPVTRKPADDVVVTFSGGYHASGAPGRSRLPVPTYPAGLSYFAQEGAGEVQTPLRGAAARRLNVGDLVWFRHAKAGEMCERFTELLLVRGGQVVERVPTYRGEGQSFG
ncbi:alanine racemase [Cumulibacter manganitolerans]|uniref:alanine racemase n=1 Tax=Cumulibacter manganitolerans TaxID=1884992 RepID=UPI001E4334E0|nr:alanine racemase [Cumulibacter manganitolerans]